MNEESKMPKPHQFQKGVSGNPAGRPKGSKNAISIVKLQLEGELRAQMRPNMSSVLKEIIRQALPTEKVNEKTGEITIIPGSQEMLKLLFNSWVSKTKSSEDESPKEKIQIVIGKLDQIPPINGTTYKQSNEE